MSNTARRMSMAVLLLMTVAALSLQVGAQKVKCSGGPDNANYLYVSQDCPGGPLYDWNELDASKQLPLDNCSYYGHTTKNVPIGFPFSFYGKTYSTVMANNLGQLLFEPKPGVNLMNCYYYYSYFGIADCTPSYYCSTNEPNYQVAAYWSTIAKNPNNPASGIYAETTGPVGDRVLTVMWKDFRACPYGFVYMNVCYYGDYYQYSNYYLAGGPIDFEVKLFERGNVIEVHHKASARGAGLYGNDYGCVTQGIEGKGNQAGKKWNGLAYINAGKGTSCYAVTYTPPKKWAIRYVQDAPPVAAFENYSVPPNIYHNGRLNDDSAPLPMPETSYFHPGDLILFQDRSTDADGPIKNWTWDFGDKSVKTAENYKKDPQHIYTNETAQSYTVTLIVHDGFVSSKVIKVVNVEPNEPPTIRIGVPDDGVAGEPVRFKDLSIDTDGAIDQWLWDFGDNTVSTEQNPEHTYSKAGTYKVTLRAQDDDGEADTVYQTVQVAPAVATGNNQALLDPPVAEAGPQQRVLPGSLVKLNGYQTNGHAEVYRWTQVEGPRVELAGADSSTPTFVAPPAGTDAKGRPQATRITMSLEVTDRGRTSQPDTVTILVAPLDQAPMAEVRAPGIVKPGAFVTLDGSRSLDPDGQALSFEWTQVLGPAVELVGAGTPTATFLAPDVTETVALAFQLAVGDGTQVDAATVTVTVDPREPGFTLAHRGAGEVAFIATTIGQEHVWEFGDGATGKGPSPRHVYAADGTYTVRLTTMDLDGNVETTGQDVQVDVLAAPPAGSDALVVDADQVAARQASALAPLAVLVALAAVVLVLRRK